MCTESLIKWDEFYEALDEEIRQERTKRLLVIGEARHAANVIYRREQNGGDLRCWEMVARHIIDDSAHNLDLILDNELNALAYILEWYYRRTGIFEKDWLALVDYLLKE